MISLVVIGLGVLGAIGWYLRARWPRIDPPLSEEWLANQRRYHQ